MKRTTRVTAAIGGAAMSLLTFVPAASAHVVINPGEASKGGFTVLGFRVPNERDNAGTNTVEINFPADHPIPFVSVRPQPGWTYTVERVAPSKPVEAHGKPITEVVSKIRFTGGPIRPGEFNVFEVSAGPLPDDADELLFPTLQTYEGGEIVRWIEPTPAGGEKPEHPAPSLSLVAAPVEDSAKKQATKDVSTSDSDKGDGGVTVSAVSKDDVDSAQTLAVVALVVGVVGLGVGAVGLFRKRVS